MAKGVTNYLKRTATSDANLQTGRYALLGSTEASDVLAKLRVWPWESGTGGGIYRGGALVRYVDTSNWLMMVTTGWVGALGTNPGWALIKRVAGTETVLASGIITDTLSTHQISLQALSSGTVLASISGMQGEPVIINDEDLATGGALEEGRFGIYDAWTSASAHTRKYDTLTVLTGEASSGTVCNSGKSLEVSSGAAEKEDSTGAIWSRPPLHRGANFYLDPSGDAGRVNRLTVKMRRNDITSEPDGAITDKQAITVEATERFLAPR